VRVLHITYTLNPKMGGVAQAVKTLVNELSKKSIDNEVATLDEQSAPYLPHGEFICHPLGPGKGPWKYNRKLLNWIKANNNRFDIVIIHGLWLYYSFAAHRAASKNNKILKESNGPRILVMPHGMLDPYFQNAKDRQLKAIRNWVYWKLIEKNVINDADGLLFTCQTELLLARQTFKPYKPRKEYNVGYGIEAPPAYIDTMSDAFYEQCPGFKGEPFILFLSRVHPKKGIDLLVNAYVSLYTESASKSTIPKLVIAGPGLESAYGKMLQKSIADKPELQKNICFTGMLSGDSKWGAFYNCEAFILPSHQENFGIVVAESLACGKPVLITNQVNIWREIAKEDGGLIEDDTLEGIRRLLQQWFEFSLAQKEKMCVNALSTYKKHFAIDAIVKNYTDAFVDAN